MSTAAPKITQVTGIALRKVFQLLEDQFDADAGCYRNGYSDEQIAKETSISKEAVKQYRIQAFGKIKPPSEMMVMQQELQEIETLALQLDNDLRQKLKDFRLRLSSLERRFD